MNERHHLDPLLRPASIAVVGASERPGSVGRQTIENLLTGRYEGKLYAVNPGYESVLGIPCFARLDDLPETVEHVVLTVGDVRIEAALKDTIDHGARAATMMSSLVLPDDEPPRLRERVSHMVEQSGLIVCGANGMGFYNLADGVWVCGFDTRENHVRGGNVTLISHSGSGMSGILDCEERIDFNLAVSTGQELAVSMDQYMDYALERPETRVIGLFMETARRPKEMIAAFRKARDKRIPVVVLKVGRTELSARLAVSHSGAIAGRDDAYQAVFDRFGVQRVNDMDELATALIMFAQPHQTADGGLVGLHDSGGERQLLIDLAEEMGVPLTDIAPRTRKKLEDLLDAGLPPVNPLDAWGAGGPGADTIMEECMAALMSDPDAAIGAVVHDRAPLGRLYPEYFEYMRRGHAASGKPVFLVSNRQGSGCDPAAVTLTREGMPVIDGLRPFLAGARCLFGHRDFLARPVEDLQDADPALVMRWRQRLSRGDALNEFESGQLLADFGIPVNPSIPARNIESVMAAAAQLEYPLVLKTAEPGVLHKSDIGGVHLDVRDAKALQAAYADLAGRIGPRVLLSPMLDVKGVEMVFGLVRDEQFGPLVMLGFGGINVETLKDFACSLPPFGRQAARRLLDSLKHRALLEKLRDRSALDLDALCIAAERFSLMAAALADVLSEIDVNPVILHAGGCLAVDALVIGCEVKGKADVEYRSDRRPEIPSGPD
jgi:acyl-CoA synthetase (NDP forming)